MENTTALGLLKALGRGEVDLDQVADRFRSMEFAERITDPEQLIRADALDDPLDDVDRQGDIYVALMLGWIDQAQYDQLVQAARSVS